MTRRTFLRVAAAGAVPLVAGSLVWRDSVAWLFHRSSARLVAIVRSPEERLRAHFDYLDLDPAGVERYFDDCVRYQPGFSRRMPLHADDYTGYLLCTDFFQNGADETRRIRYVGFFDGSGTGCGNPLARFDAED